MRRSPQPEPIAPGVFMVGGGNLTAAEDCLCYLAVGSTARVLIDCGAGPSAGEILALARTAAEGLDPTHLLLTHAHIDHVGGAAFIREATGGRVLIHRAEAEVLRQGDEKRSAADWYGLPLEPVEPDQELTGEETIGLGDGQTLRLLAAPGHTPGSLVAWLDTTEGRVLFGQDIHGPFSPTFGSNLDQWAKSMKRLLELEADILAEGHYGVFRPAERVRRFIEEHLAAQGR